LKRASNDRPAANDDLALAVRILNLAGPMHFHHL
jgi:hypothetical protein